MQALLLLATYAKHYVVHVSMISHSWQLYGEDAFGEISELVVNPNLDFFANDTVEFNTRLLKGKDFTLSYWNGTLQSVVGRSHTEISFGPPNVRQREDDFERIHYLCTSCSPSTPSGDIRVHSIRSLA